MIFFVKKEFTGLSTLFGATRGAKRPTWKKVDRQISKDHACLTVIFRPLQIKGTVDGKKKSPPIGPKKGINRDNKEILLFFLIQFRVLSNRFFAFSRGPGGFRELREAGRKLFHLSWYLLVPGITSYDEKPWGGECFFTVGL